MPLVYNGGKQFREQVLNAPRNWKKKEVLCTTCGKVKTMTGVCAICKIEKKEVA